MDRSSRLGEAAIPRLLLQFSIPAIVGMMAQALYNIIDAVFVGQALGTDAVAGTTVAFPCMLIVLAFGMLLGFGATALISIRLGQQNKAEAEHVLGNAAVLLVVAAALGTALGLWFLDPILVLFGASETVLPYARDYLGIIVLGTVFQMISFGLNATIRGEGNPRIAMLTMLISVLLNLLLAPVFIFGLRWGMKGAALATVTAQAVSAVWVLAYYLSGASLLKLHARHLRPDWRICRAIFWTGSPQCTMQLAASVMLSILNNQLKYYGGDLAIAVWGILYRIFMLVAMPIFGINQGVQPIIGYNYGARRFDRVKRALVTAILAATVLTTLGFSVAMLFPAEVVRLFNPKDPALLALGTHAIRISMLGLPLVGFQVVSASYFQAVGKPREALLLMLSRQVLLLIPAVLILPRLFGLEGVWAALPTADVGACLLTGLCLLAELRRLDDRGHHAQHGRPGGTP
jgi:putative MATE family efflux protein